MPKLCISSQSRVLAALLAAGCSRGFQPALGDELFAIADDALLEVALRAPKKRAEARRFEPSEPFQFSFETARSFTRCRATERLENMLLPVRSLRIHGVLGNDEAKAFRAQHSVGHATELMVRDISDRADPFRLWLWRDGQKAHAMLPDDGDQHVLAVDAALLHLLDAECAD